MTARSILHFISAVLVHKNRARCGPGRDTRVRGILPLGILIQPVLVTGIIVIGTPSGSEAAEPPPRLAVVFQLAELNYRWHYTAAERRAIEAGLAEDASQSLHEWIGVFEFTPEDATDSLRIVIGDSTDHGLAPVLFALTVSGVNVTKDERPVTWEFRDVGDALLPPGEPDAFRTAAAGFFADQVENNRDQLVTNLLRLIVLTRNAERDEQGPQFWILPFRANDLRLGRDSTFRLLQSFIDEEGNDVMAKHTCEVWASTHLEQLVMIRVLDKDSSGVNLLDNPNLHTDAVLLFDYRRPAQIREPIPPVP